MYHQRHICHFYICTSRLLGDMSVFASSAFLRSASRPPLLQKGGTDRNDHSDRADAALRHSDWA